MPPPRASLASIICPSTPFLAPRLLRAPPARAAPELLCYTHTRIQQHSTKPKRNDRKKKAEKPRAKRPEDSMHSTQMQMLDKFSKACEMRALPEMMAWYPSIKGSSLLSRQDTRRIAQAIHTYLRSNPSRKPDIDPFIERVVQDICSGGLPPSPQANVHILSLFKESKEYDRGIKFWQWLSGKDDTFVDPAVYGAAIELLAYQGNTELPVLEDLYIQALKRFPGTFAEYHLSPDAIVPDRTQPLSIMGIPMSLLQGIMTARVLAHDWKNAYLAFDTALRLHPADLPHRFFEIFMIERSLTEAYTVFLMGCRAGVVFQPGHLTSLLKKLRIAEERTYSLQDRITLVRGMSNAIYAYLECGGTLEGPHIGSLLNAFGALLPLKEPGNNFEGDEAIIRDQIAVTAHRIAASLFEAAMTPHPQVFTALISLAGKLRVPGLLTVSLNDVQSAQIDISDIGRRIVLLAAGDLQDTDLIKQYWTQIASHAEQNAGPITRVDWLTLARVCKRAGCEDYAREQLKTLKHAISTEHELSVLEELNLEQTRRERPLTFVDPTAFSRELDEIIRQTKDIATITMSGQPLDIHQSPFSMVLDPSKPPLATLSDLNVVYDELTTDPHQPPPEADVKTVAQSPTGISLGDLRFQNWVSVLELMAEAERAEAIMEKRVTWAMANNRPLDTSFINSFRSEGAPAESLKDELRSLSELRSEIKRLRAPTGPVENGSSRHAVGNSSWSQRSKRFYTTLAGNTANGSATRTRLSNIEPELTARPTLRYYVSLESSHVAPQP